MKKLYFLILWVILPFYTVAQIDIKDELPLTYADIAKKAKDQWPGDYEMQKYTIENQCKALNEYLKLKTIYEIPEDVYKEILMNALDKWCEGDWVDCVNANKDNYDKMVTCWSPDWEMLVYEMKKQIKAYIELNQ